MNPELSIVVPTRDRATYLKHSLLTCVDNDHVGIEVVVLDNASTDNTEAVVRAIGDPRVRYLRSSSRLSMRDNFERGLEAARGDILCFIGDDDGVFPFTADNVLNLFNRYPVEAVSAARAHYFWPDLRASRRDTALLPRREGVSIRDSRTAVRTVLEDCDYYRLPCLYHGFVKRSVVERVRQRQGRFFLSNNVDIFSAIALSLEGIQYAFSESPLVINGGSSRSNGAAHFGGGSEHEKALWKQEDELGFLPAFADSLTMGAFIVESAVRYAATNGHASIGEIFGEAHLRKALELEKVRRLRAGRSAANAELPLKYVGLRSTRGWGALPTALDRVLRGTRLLRSFIRNCPVDMAKLDIDNVHDASRWLARMAIQHRAGVLNAPLEQFKVAARIARS